MIRHTARLLLAGAFVFGGMTLISSEASAQATRTWVSGVGDDANPCSRTAPCKTFQGTISKTAAGGEINCIDPGGFGAFTITKSISIICDDVEAGILVSGTNGIVINAGVNDTVVISGLELEGFGSALSGIKIFQVGAVHVMNTTIADFRGTNGAGITFNPPNTGAKLFVSNSYISENGTATTGGIVVQPTGTAGSAKVTITNSHINNNVNFGLNIDTTGNTGAGIQFTVDGTEISANGAGIGVNNPASTTGVKGIVTNSVIASNTAFGILSNGTSAVVRVGNTTIANNGSFAVLGAGGPPANFGVLSFSPASNKIVGNGTDGNFSGTAIAQQ